MVMKEDEIRRLSNFIFESLLRRDELVLKASEDEIIEKIFLEIKKDMAREEKLEEEVEEIIDKHMSGASGPINRRKLFIMVKNKLAKERGIIL